MKRALTLGMLIALLLAAQASANDSMYLRWPRFVPGPAQISVAMDTANIDNAAWEPAVVDAIASWNQSPYVHLTLIPPTPCAGPPAPWPHVVCVVTYQAFDGRGGYAAALNDPIGNYPHLLEPYSRMISWAVANLNRQYIPMDGFWDRMIACHEIGEAIGLPDPSDSPVTPTGDSTCLTRDYGLLTTTPGGQDFWRLSQLYSYTSVDPSYAPWCYSGYARNGRCQDKKGGKQ